MSSFENLEVWKRSKDLAVLVIDELKNTRNYGLKDQIIRSAISVPSNVAEGAERKGNKEFSNFLSYASGSCAELLTQIQIASELGEIPKITAEKLITECREISRMLYGLRKPLDTRTSGPSKKFFQKN